MIRWYACWPDDSGERAWFRHYCADRVETTLLPKGPWRFDGQRVTPSVSCEECCFHMFIEKTHDTEPTEEDE